MKKLGKSLLSVILALLIAIGTMPTAFASNENQNDVAVASEMTNIALGRKYTSAMFSSAGKWYSANTTDSNCRLTDGKFGSLSSYNTTYWAGWLTASSVTFDFDLGCVSEIYEVNTHAFNTEMHGISSPGKYEVYSSVDGINWKEAYVNSAVHGLEWMEYAATTPIEARFVRVVVSQGVSNFIFLDEIEIIGTGGKDVVADPDANVVANQAVGKPYTFTAEGADVYLPDANLSLLTDGNKSEYVGWKLSDNSAEVSVQLNLLSSKAVDSVTAQFKSGNLPSDMTVYIADTIVNGKANWVKMGSKEVKSASETYTFDKTYKAQYVKLVFTQNSDIMGISEIEVTGKGDVSGAEDHTQAIFSCLDKMTDSEYVTYETSKIASGYSDTTGKLTDGTLDNWVGFDHLTGVTRYVKVDLGGVYKTRAFTAVFDKNNLPSEIYILTSVDGVNWEAARKFTNDIVASGNNFTATQVLGESVETQYVMFTFYKASGTSALSEVAVYGEGTKLDDGIAKPDKGYMIPGKETDYVKDAVVLDTDTALQYIDAVIECGFDAVLLEGSNAKEPEVLEALNAKATKPIKVDAETDISAYPNLEFVDPNLYVSKDFDEAKANGHGVHISDKGTFEEHLATMDELVSKGAQGKYVYKVYSLNYDISEYLTDEETAKVFENYKKLIKGTLKKSHLALTVAPVVESSAGNWIKLSAVNGYEYSIDGREWSKDPLFINLDPSTEYTLYQRVAETANKEGSVYSAIKLTTSSEASAKLPVIETDIPSEMAIYKGKSFALEVSVEPLSYGDLSYQWYKDGVAISGATDSSYIFDVPSAQDTGVYNVVVTSSYNGTVANTSSSSCNVTFINENVNLLKGASYRHDVTVWHNGTSNEPGNSLTDGVYGTGWGSGNFLDAQQKNAKVLFELDAPVEFKEIDLYTYANSSGISAPHVQILIKETKDDEQWLEIYSGPTDNGATLDQHTAYLSNETITATSIKFAFTMPSGNAMIFVREIELYNEATGYTVRGTLADNGVYVPGESFDVPSEEPDEPSEPSEEPDEPSEPSDVTRENLIAGVTWITNIPDTQFVYSNGPAKLPAMLNWLTDGNYARDTQYSSTAGIVGFNESGYIEFDIGKEITFRHVALHTATKQSFANNYVDYQDVYIEVYKDGAWYKLNTPADLPYEDQKTYYFASDKDITASKIRFGITGRKGLYITSFTEFEVFAYPCENTADVTLSMSESAVAVPKVEIVNGDALKVAKCDYVTLATKTTVEGEGGNITYQWYKDGTAISGATHPYYTIYDANEASAGTYKVAATNGGETVSAVSSDEIKVTVEGEVYNYALGKPYEWTNYETNIMYTNKNYADTDFKEMTDGKVPTAVSYGEAGYVGAASWKTYELVVDLGENGATFDSAKVVFMSTNNSGILMPGTVKFYYRNTTEEAWTEMGTWICADRRIPGIMVAYAESAEPITARYVRVTTYNDALVFASEFMVMGDVPKAAAPVITTNLPITKEIAEGEATVLEVSATTSDAGVLSYQWYKDGVAIAGATSASYEVTEAGLYKVAVMNTLGNSKATVESSVCAVTVKASAGYTVSGSLTKSGSTEAATIELIADGEVVATTTIGGKTGDYAFENVAAGSYTLKVTKSKHAAREYEVVVADADVEQNVEVWLYGDVTADGMVNNSDVMQINRRSTNQASMFDQAANQDYRLIVANVTAITGTDKLINNADVMQINRKNTNQASVFDRLA